MMTYMGHMKRTAYSLACLLATLLLSAGCSRRTTEALTATPSPCVLRPDSAGGVQLDLLFHLPKNYLARRNRAIIVPQLMQGDSVAEEFAPLVVDASIYAKKTHRLKVLEGYHDPYGESAVAGHTSRQAQEVPYSSYLPLPSGVEGGTVRAVVSNDGCGECTGFDTLDVAVISNLLPLIDLPLSMKCPLVEKEFVIRPKIREGAGEAHLQFVINRWEIQLDMGDNRRELDKMVATLEPVLKDSLATLNYLAIIGMASADGSLPFNTVLSRNRAASARQWVTERLELTPTVQKRIRVDSRPEGWEPVLAAMTAAGNPDSVKVKEILARYADSNDDVQERYIRRLPCWNVIRRDYLQKDRKVEYTYAYTMKSFTTDAQLLDMYRKRPDAFNEEELLRVASLVETPEEREEVYRTVLRYFPESAVAATNLSSIYVRTGRYGEALEVLGHMDERSPEVLNVMAASYGCSGQPEKAVELLRGVNTSAARYNLGLLMAKRHRLDEAYRLLSPYADVNAALVALSLGKTGEAAEMLSRTDDGSPTVEYARAIVAARQERHGDFYLHLAHACRDGKLRARMGTEADFRPYGKEPQFLKIIGEK